MYKPNKTPKNLTNNKYQSSSEEEPPTTKKEVTMDADENYSEEDNNFEKESPIEDDIDKESPAESGSIHDETSERSAGRKSGGGDEKYIQDFYDE